MHPRHHMPSTPDPLAADKYPMAVDAQTIMVVNGGGLRSLVATAVVLSGAEPHQVILLHLRDGRPNAAARADFLRRQAKHFQIARMVQIDVPHMQSEPYVQVHQDVGSSMLVRPQSLLIGIAQAIRYKAQRLLWPVQFNADHATVGRVTEQVVLLEHVAQLEQSQLPAVEMPLLELTDQQLIELGAQLDVPWDLAWTCMLGQPRPCFACAACNHRHAAFESAGITDPIERHQAMR